MEIFKTGAKSERPSRLLRRRNQLRNMEDENGNRDAFRPSAFFSRFGAPSLTRVVPLSVPLARKARRIAFRVGLSEPFERSADPTPAIVSKNRPWLPWETGGTGGCGSNGTPWRKQLTSRLRHGITAEEEHTAVTFVSVAELSSRDATS